MDSRIVVNQVLILFLIMIIGFFARKKRVLTPDLTKGFTSLLLNVTCPLTIFTAFQLEYSASMLVSAGQALVFTMVIHLFSIVISLFLYNKYPTEIKQVLRFSTIFSNCGFMGFPLLQSIYGKTGVFYGSIYVIGFHLFIWTVGVSIFTGHQDRAALKKVLTNPNIIAVFLGIITFLLPIKLPAAVNSALEMVAAMNTPLSMLLVGSVLTEVKLTEMFTGFPVYYGTFVRLLLMPFCALLITDLFGFSPLLQGACVLVTATPVASLTTAFTEKYNGDSLLASRLTLLSTLGAIITLPFIGFLLNK